MFFLCIGHCNDWLWEGEEACLNHEPGNLPKTWCSLRREGGNTVEKSLDFLSYPFLHEKERMVDHEVCTDELASYLGFILAKSTPLYEETFWLMDKVLHLNGSVRGENAITDADTKQLLDNYQKLKENNKERLRGFVYPIGHPIACHYHVARGMAKRITRNLYLIEPPDQRDLQPLIDFSNLMTNYLFACSLEINRLHQVEEIPFESKSYIKKEK